jgi:hypothetical protein
VDFQVGDSHCAVLVVLDREEGDLSNLTKERRGTVVADRVYRLRGDLNAHARIGT